MTEKDNLAEVAMKIIHDRRSIRDYSDEPVSEEDMRMVLEAGRLAPSGENAQPWRFIVVRDAATRERLARSPEAEAAVGLLLNM